MTALLRDALAPNLVQTLENNPAFIHGGPFANIAHGCNSVMATKTALKLADYVVTEARLRRRPRRREVRRHQVPQGGPEARRCAVIVATMRALKYHGGVEVAGPRQGEPRGAREGHRESRAPHRQRARPVYGLPCVVAINHRAEDTDAETQLAAGARSTHHGVKIIVAKHFAEGGKGAVELAKEVVRAVRAAEQLQVRLRGRADAVGQDEDHRHARSTARSTSSADSKVRAQIKHAAGSGLRALPGVRGEDAVLVLDRPEAARRADGPRGEHPRSAPRRRRGVRRDDLRRHHDDAGPAGDPGGEQHRRRRRRQDRGLF